MEIGALIKKMKYIYSSLIDFIDTSDNSDAEFQSLFKIFDKQAISENKEEVQLLFQLISKLADDHHRTSGIFNKFEKIYQYLIKDAPSPISLYHIKNLPK